MSQESESMRTAFGKGLVEAARQNPKVIALSADLTESIQLNYFQEEFPKRFIQVGVAEQNLVTVASGLASMGQIPFVGSYAAFSPGRNWEQIKTTICINNQPVKIIGSHAGLNVGEDGATHQMLEDIALMRVLPNMVVIAPGDASEARQVAISMTSDLRPNFVRLPRAKTPNFLSHKFEIGKAYRLNEGSDITLIGTGTMTYQLAEVAKRLSVDGVSVDLIHVPTIKPLDESLIIESASKTGRVVVAEEAQIAGGLGGAVSEVLSENHPVSIRRVGVVDRYGESGTVGELWQTHGLDIESIYRTVIDFIK